MSVSFLWTLFHESTGCSAIEGLWGTFDLWTDRLRGNGGGEGRGGATLCNRATVQLPNLGIRGCEKEGPYRAVGPSPVQSIAAYCSRLQGRSCKYALFLTPPPLCQRGGRRFEPGLVLQHSRVPSRCCAEGLFVGGDGPTLGAAAPTHRYDAASWQSLSDKCVFA
jgi:hypothetical protein